MCVCVCVCVYIYIYICICMYMYIYTYISIYVDLSIYTHTYRVNPFTRSLDMSLPFSPNLNPYPLSSASMPEPLHDIVITNIVWCMA